MLRHLAISEEIDFYNTDQPCLSYDNRIPEKVYFIAQHMDMISTGNR